jgi:hypothetical protein
LLARRAVKSARGFPAADVAIEDRAGGDRDW